MASSPGSHWKSAVDPRTGRTYFYHEVTRETQWRKPMELASNEERMNMERKERKQKDFFAAMEANILNSMSLGEVPGQKKTKKQNSLRRKSSRKPPQGDGRPDLIRTISTMDESVLINLVRRQPSFRAVVNNGPREPSLQPGDSPPGRRGSTLTSRDFESFVSIKTDMKRLDSVQESCNESMPELFSYAADDESNMDSLEGSDFGYDSRTNSEVSEKMEKSSLSGFGLTWEETRALKKLADISKEMADSEHVKDFDFESPFQEYKVDVGVTTPSWKGRKDKSKGKRDLPREIEFSDEEDEDDENQEAESSASTARTNSASRAFQKARDIGGRELDFDDSSEEGDDDILSDIEPSPRQERPTSKPKEKIKAKEAEEEVEEKRPEVKRRNTCGTIYVGTTMSAPDKDATIKCVCGVYRTHILSSLHDEKYDPAKNAFRIFNDHESEQGGYEITFHNDDKPKMHIPSLEEMSRFYRDIFYKAQMENDCIIMSLIYVERLIKRTNGLLRPREDNWRSLIFSCMILSSKVWDDLSMWNADFSQSCPPGVSFPLQRINELELAVLNALGFQVKVPASEYAKYYFLLRSMLIKSGLGDETGAMDPLDVVGARRLQEVSSQFEHLKDPSALSKRSQSVATSQLSRSNKVNASQPKVNLEHVVNL